MAEYVLEIVEGPGARRRIRLVGPTEVGRDPSCGVDLPDDELVSRIHARLVPLENGVRVEDLGSRNGTFVDGDRISPSAHLAPGGRLAVGATVLELRAADERAGPETAGRAAPADLRPINVEEPDLTSRRKTPEPPPSRDA